MRDIEQIIKRITAEHPGVRVRQLPVAHPGADDDGLWFFKLPAGEFEVQLESPDGMCPFLIETDQSDQRTTATSVDTALDHVRRLLHLPHLNG
jgi:hypothetical protein